MYIRIDDIAGSTIGKHAGTGERTSVEVRCEHETYRDTLYFVVTISASTVHVRQTDSAYAGLPDKPVDIATVEIATDLIAATRRLHNLVR